MELPQAILGFPEHKGNIKQAFHVILEVTQGYCDYLQKYVLLLL